MSEPSRSYSFDPIVGDNPTILILGTLPGKDSLQLKEYYANKRNRFWRIISALLNEAEPTGYAEKKEMLQKHGIAIWDVAHSAIRPGSLDADITDEEMNPIAEFVKKYPTIKTIAFNGKAAAKKYKQHGGCFFSGIRMLTLNSSSPANCQYSEEEMIENWRQILESSSNPETAQKIKTARKYKPKPQKQHINRGARQNYADNGSKVEKILGTILGLLILLGPLAFGFYNFKKQERESEEYRKKRRIEQIQRSATRNEPTATIHYKPEYGKYYNEGYEKGYAAGQEDTNDGEYRAGYDDTNPYTGDKAAEYRDGYDHGYEDAFEEIIETSDEDGDAEAIW